ncbi:unnamed protein product, partial [Prorocentrum cordatum]
MAPKGSGAAYRISVEKKERAHGVSFQVRLLAKDGSSLHGPLRDSRAAVAADRERIAHAPDWRAELRRLLQEPAQVDGEGPQTPQRQLEDPGRRRMTGKRAASPRPPPTPGAPSKTRLQTLGTPAAGARGRRTPGSARSRGPTPRTAGGKQDRFAMTFQDVLAFHKQRDRMPLRKHGGPENDLARRWGKARRPAKLTPAARGLMMRVYALAAQAEAAKQRDSRAARAEQALLMLHQHWCEGNDVHDEDRWRQPALHRSRGGQRPYPCLSNLCNTCYLNAPLQCLLHCPAARAALLGVEGEGEPLVVQDPGATAATRARLRVDSWSPRALVEAFIAKHRFEYELGGCAGASGALVDMMQDAPSLHNLFHFISSNGEEEVVMRPPYFVDGADDGDDAISPQEFMGIVEGTQKLNMRDLIRRGTSMRALATRPEVLAVYVDPRWRRGDTLFYMSGIGHLPDWGDVPEVALQVGGEDVVYRLRSYVQCKLPEEKSIAPAGLLTDPEGHYVAHFEEGGEWCTADDLGDRAHVARRPPGTHHAMPVLVFLEPVDSRAARAAECPWPPGQVVDSAGGAGDEGDVSADGEGCPRLDGGKRLRLRGKQSAAGRQQSRAGRQQSRAGRQQERQQSRAGRQQSRAGRQQERQQSRAGRQQSRDDQKRGCRPEEVLRQGRKLKSKGDNADGSRHDAQNNAAAPVLRSSREAKSLQAACDARRECGDLFLLLHLLEPLATADDLLKHYPDFFVYAGDDCANRWATFLRAPDRPDRLAGRLREALGVAEEEISDAKRRLESGEWHMHHVAELLDERLNSAHSAHSAAAAVRLAVGDGPGAQDDGNPLRAHLADAWQHRPCDRGPPRHSAMPARLRDRSEWFQCPAPALHYACRMCEAEFPNREAFKARQGRVHGGQRWYQSQHVARCELEPYQPSPTEERQVVARFHMSQCCATVDPVDEPFVPKPEPEVQKQLLHAEIIGRIIGKIGQWGPAEEVSRQAADAAESAALAQAACQTREPRAFKACVCSAMQQRSENLHSEYLVGDKCTIKDRAQFADCLSAEWYHQRWPLIPRDELMSSAVDFPRDDCEGSPTSTKILLHKRRVPPEALEGKVPVRVCDDCRGDLWSDRPRVPLMALVNDLWLGRHHPLLRKAALAHQMLLALGRAVSTKIYLSSKGADKAVRQGAAIVFGNGIVDHAMRSFPPEPDMLGDTFVAVFAGADDDEEGIPLTEEQKQERALRATREEVALHVDKAEYDAQARLLKQRNYVCNDPGVQCRSDHVDRFPRQPGVPDFTLACAKYVPTDAALDDVAQAQGPASATTGAQAEMSAAAEDAQELTKWLSVLEDHMDDVSELAPLPALQGMLERMESQAGRVVANELMSRLEDQGGGDRALQLDEIGRHRLRDLCQEFHARCRKISPGEDMAKLRWRVQALETNNCQAEEGAGDPARPAGVAGTPAEDDPRSLQGPPSPDGQRKAKLRVPTSRKAESWWNPKYWSIARPTDFCYGDCAWGLGQLPPDGDEGPQKQKEGRLCFSVAHFIKNLLTREETEYDVPADEEKYVARPISRFRSSWYDVHLLCSFWRVTETTNSTYTFMKTPGAFGAARACADITPEMIEEVQLRAQQTGGKATLRGILKDKDTPNEVRKAFATLGQAAASQVGSDGHRRELRGEGEAYALRFGPPVQFVTPNLADTKQPLILIVQGEEYTFDNDLTEAEQVTFSEMSQRIAVDPVGQAVVFELMMRLFFVHVLGLRPETVGWRRGEVRKASEHWISDGVAADLMGVPTVFGPLAAAFGPVEAQGRGSLHPRILIWLLQGQLRVLLDMLQRDEARFQERLNLWMRQVLQAVVATQQSAVELLPLQLQGGENKCGVAVPPLPFGPNEKRYFRADGGAEMATAEQLGVEGETEPQELWFYEPKVDDYHRAIRPDLPLRNNDGEAVDGDAAWTEQRAAENKGYWRRPLSSSASGIFPRYRGGGTLAESLPSDEWIREMCRDARELVIGCGIHVCSPSCYKYHSDETRGVQICRHNFYNLVTLCTWPEGGDSQECRLRTRGMALRGCIGIFRETDYGMAGRVAIFQLHPGETSTKYAAVVSARCNVDVQDMTGAPPRLWMDASELEPPAIEEDRKSYNHGLYPQRYADFSVGARDDWGWFQHLNTTSAEKELANRDSPAVDDGDVARADLQGDLERHALATFVDAHNTSYCVNSYTTKVNPSMDDVLCKLLDGVRRLKSQWDDREAQAAGGAGDEAQSTAAGKRKEDFKRTLQVLARFETCFRRASWKSGSEMVFPMLFGHLSFMTHRCWKVFMRKSIYLAAESWSRRYGQADAAESAPAASITYAVPGTGQQVTMPGWREVQREGETVYVSPDGEEFDAIEYAHQAFQIANASGGSMRDVTKALNRMREGEAEEVPEAPGPTVEGLAQGKFRGAVLSQHDDWMHRGDHPIVRDMSLYVYSIWVYRVELPLHALPAGELDPEGSGGRTLHVDIAFDSSYSAARNWAQRLAVEPRIPKADGFQFVSAESNVETHYLMKSVLLRPVHLPDADGPNDTKELRYLRAYEHLRAAPEGELEWPAQP